VKTPQRAPTSSQTTAGSFRLYIAGNLPQSVAAVRNIEQLRRDGSLADIDVEIVDTLSHPARSVEDGIVVTPTLVRVSPKPRIAIIGSLSELDKVRAALGLGTAKDATP
jgi:circadian clock protein KaiB